MASFAKVRVAAVQATPAILDAEATVEKAIGLLQEFNISQLPVVRTAGGSSTAARRLPHCRLPSSRRASSTSW